MLEEFLNQRHGTFFFIAILDGIFFALTVVVFPKVLRLNLNLLRTLPADEGLNIRSEFLPDLTKIMNETKMTLMVKYF
jgi:hypothetical protein